MTEPTGHLARDAAAVETLLRGADLRAPAPGLAWSVGDVAGHLGSVHRWATAVLSTGEPQDEPQPHGDPVDWYARGWPPLLRALSTADLGAPCWGFGPRPRTAAFWARRMAHETALHLLDVRRAVGLPPDMPQELAADGIAEMTEVFLPRQLRLGRCPPLPHAAQLIAAEGRWLLGEGTPATVVRGPALDLLLLVWRREIGALDVQGEPLEPLLALALTP